VGVIVNNFQYNLLEWYMEGTSVTICYRQSHSVVAVCNSTRFSTNFLLHLHHWNPEHNSAHHRKNESFLDGRKNIWY